MKNQGKGGEYSYYEVSDGKHSFKNSLSHEGILHYEDWLGLDIASVYIPTMDMLSHSKGLLALNQKYELPFDGTQIDIIVNASLPETREVPDYMKKILNQISDAIGGTVVMEEDVFYVKKKNGMKIDFSLEAEGLRKLGVLWKLIRNGLLEPGTVLLWDEPEANLNPELFPLVVELLLELEEAGIQIFVATHSYNLAKYFELRRRKEEQVQFHNLFKKIIDVHVEEKSAYDKEENEIICENSAFYLGELHRTKLMEADEQLLDEAMKSM